MNHLKCTSYLCFFTDEMKCQNLHFSFLVASGRSARDAQEQEKKSSRFLCAWSLFIWRVRRLFRGTQGLFSVKYLSGEANLV